MHTARHKQSAFRALQAPGPDTTFRLHCPLWKFLLNAAHCLLFPDALKESCSGNEGQFLFVRTGPRSDNSLPLRLSGYLPGYSNFCMAYKDPASVQSNPDFPLIPAHRC